MTKSELIDRVAQASSLTKARAEMVVNTIFDAMTAALAQGDGIEIRGFGSFSVRTYKSYEGRNPRTGDVVHVAPKRLPFFKVGKELRERVNGRWRDAVAPAETTREARTEARSERAASAAPKPAPRRRDDSLSEDAI